MSENSSDRFRPGFAAKRYPPNPKRMERNIREGRIQLERDKRARKKLIEEGKIPPDPDLDEEYFNLPGVQ